MRRIGFALFLALLGCAPRGDERWRYERVLWEHSPELASHAAVEAARDRTAAQASLTVGECYRLALSRSETLALQGESLVRLEAEFDDVLATALPRLSFKANWTRQDTAGLRQSGDGGGGQNSFTLRDRPEYRLNLHQTLFSGLKEFYARSQGDALADAGEHSLRHARLLLFDDVATAFYAVLQVARDIETTRESLRLAEERLEELTHRQTLGMSRRSEVLAQEAEAASTRARLERLSGSRTVAWETLQYLTGLDGPRDLVDSLPEPGPPGPVESYLAEAATLREDLRRRDLEITAAEKAVGVARAGAFPTLAMDANYYTRRSGFSDGIDWDLIFALDMPLFDGFATDARLRAARSDVRAASLERTRAGREAALEVRRGVADVAALRSELDSLEKALASARENHEILQAEYRRDIVTNLEVLAGFDRFQQAVLERDRTRTELKLAGARLALRCGRLPAEAP